MSGTRRFLIVIVGLAVIGIGLGERASRHLMEHRYRDAMASRQQLALQYGELLASHERVAQQLAGERQQSQALLGDLAAMRFQLEVAVGRLTEEAKTVLDLQHRLAAMQQQMDQLQGELSLAIEARQTRAAQTSDAQVQLERIVVSNAATAGIAGRVVSIHSDWNFVVVNLGWDAVRIGDILSIFRESQLLAKARIERVQQGLCAATLLPEWEHADIHVNDIAKTL